MGTPKAATPPWNCPTCKTRVSTPYCATCGESPVLARDLTLRGLLRQLFHDASSIDGRVLRTLRTLLTRPGALTVAYAEGPRKPYMGPFQLFLLANVIFVAVQSMTGTNVFSSPLASHLHHQDWSAYAQRLVAARLEAKQTTLESYAPVFDRAVAFNAKSLVILMTLPFSLLMPILFVRSRRTFGVHAIFAVHVYSFLLLLYCVALVVAGIDTARGGAGLESAHVDTALTVFNLASSAAYLYLAIGPVYQVKGPVRIVASIVLAASILAILLGYRFALFVFTLYVT